MKKSIIGSGAGDGRKKSIRSSASSRNRKQILISFLQFFLLFVRLFFKQLVFSL